MNYEEVVNRINALVAEKGIKKADFYKACRVSSAAFSQWKTGKTEPRMSSLQVIADYFNVTLEYICYGDESKKIKPALSLADLTAYQLKLLEVLSELPDDAAEDLVKYAEFRKAQSKNPGSR